ncbi:MAG TPA: HlyD family efflux transporter periplasmic adaptor subunit [Steroidobacteraceae bacterium]|nr:HlyD family efflux transporter periplasmic adaptor subunit [Steroidobacteraceae bacterium]
MRSAARIGILAALALSACAGGDDPQDVLGTLERDRLELIAESNERLVELFVEEGDRVTAGAPLARQEAGAMEPRLAQSRASLAEAERRLGDLVEGPRSREIDEARATLKGAESTLTTERREYQRVADLVERKLLSASDLDQARARRDAAQAARDEARARLRLLEEGTRPEQLAQARAAVDRAKAAVAELMVSAERYSVRAPRPGLIEALPYEVGERPPVGAPLVIMLADGAPYARVHVPEPLRVAFAAGTAVEVRIDGVTDPLPGTVRYVSSQASFTPYNSLTQKDRSRLAYLAEITLEGDAASNLPAGVPVQVRLADGR